MGDIQVKHPLAFSAASKVHSLVPADVSSPQWIHRMRYSKNKPIIVVGSGKTAMDVMNYLNLHLKGVAERLCCIAGRGTFFINRGALSGNQSSSETSAPDFLDHLVNCLQLFDGTNGKQVCQEMQ